MGESQDRHCFYHWKIHDIRSCQKCGKLICDECTNLYPKKNNNADAKQTKMCPECYLKVVEDKYKPYNIGFIGMIFLMVFFGLILGSLNYFIAFSVIMIIFLVLFIGLATIIALSRELNDARKIYNKAWRDLRKLRENLKKKQIETQNPSETQAGIPKALLCRFCGAQLNRYSDCCDYCGTHWIWMK